MIPDRQKREFMTTVSSDKILEIIPQIKNKVHYECKILSNEKYNRAKLIEKGIRENSTRWFHNGNSTVEVPVSQFWGLKENLPKQQQMLIDQTERIREKTICDKNHHS